MLVSPVSALVAVLAVKQLAAIRREGRKRLAQHQLELRIAAGCGNQVLGVGGMQDPLVTSRFPSANQTGCRTAPLAMMSTLRSGCHTFRPSLSSPPAPVADLPSGSHCGESLVSIRRRVLRALACFDIHGNDLRSRFRRSSPDTRPLHRFHSRARACCPTTRRGYRQIRRPGSSASILFRPGARCRCRTTASVPMNPDTHPAWHRDRN